MVQYSVFDDVGVLKLTEREGNDDFVCETDHHPFETLAILINWQRILLSALECFTYLII